MIKVGSDFCGVGAFIQALNKSKIAFNEIHACDFNYYARITYIHNYGTDEDKILSKTPEHKIFSDGIELIALGKTNSKTLITLLKKVNSEGKNLDEQILDFRKKSNQFAKSFSFYYPFDVYDRDIPDKDNSLDIYMTSPPCQAFSLAGKRKGEDDIKGVLFYNSHEFIKINKPRYFIFENVKGLLSDDNGKTFARWCDMLGGKSVNGNPVIFPHEDSVPYHIYHKVLNAKNYGVPQNRERIFIIGIRDDKDNNFSFPKEQSLIKRLKDVLEDNVDEKYYLSDNLINYFEKHKQEHKDKGNGFAFEPRDINKTASAISTKAGSRQTDNFIKVKSATSKGYELAEIGEDSINLEHPNSETRRGRVGKSVAQTLTTSCNQGVAIIDDIYNNRDERVYKEFSPTIRSERQGLKVDDNYKIRKLTPRECFRLMDFPDTFDFSVVSDSQAYKQAGNSIVVNVLAEIIKKLNF